MKYRNLSIWKNVDKPLFLFYFILSIIGYLVMYSSNYNGFEIQDFLLIAGSIHDLQSNNLYRLFR